MVLTYTSDKIKELIRNSVIAEPYPEGYLCALDEKLDGARVIATHARKMLSEYFKQHPEDSIENYK